MRPPHLVFPCSALAALFGAVLAAAQVPAPAPDSAAARTLRAAPRAAEIRIDGWLDEQAWTGAEAATDFTQSYPEPGAPPSQRTEARVLYDDAALYVGVRMYDTRPDSIAAQLARRDAFGIYSDWAHVMVDSYHDRRTAFRFSVNPRGVQKDVYHFDDGNEDLSWDAVWQVATQIDSLGWTAEYRIPLSQLRFNAQPPGTERVWGLQIQRDLARRDERASWSPWTRTSPGYVSRFGDLTGLAGVRPARRAEIQPYVSTRLTRAPGSADNPFYAPNDATLSAGADFKVGLSSALTLTGTLNPDFGQVEVDPAVVNLSAFETFFEERRPFFVEGADIFRFGQIRSFNNYNFEEYFYSRRIGRPPQRGVGGADILYTDAPDQSTILGAAKVSGKTGDGWTIGVMDAVTAEEEARYLERFVGAAGDTLRHEKSTAVEPLTNYFVGRGRRDLRGGGTVLGGMLTATHRDMGDTVFTPLLRSAAYFGGVDFEHSWAGRTWTLSGYLAASRVQGSERVIQATQRASARYFQRPDADYLELDSTRTDLSGHMAEIAIRRNGDWDMSLDFKQTSPGFEINDVGFQGRVDYRSLSSFLGRRANQAGRIFRSGSYYGYATHAWNFGGTRIFEGYGGGANGTLNNFWSGYASLNYNPEFLSDRLTRGGPLARAAEGWQIDAGINSDSRKRVSAGLNLGYRRDAAGEHERSVGLELDIRPSSALRLRLEPELSWERNVDQFVRSVADPLAEATFGSRYVFANTDRTTVSMETRLDWTFTPNLSLQLFAQPFISAGNFWNYKEFLTPGTFDFAVYGEDRGTVRGNRIDPDGAGPAEEFTIPDRSSARDFNIRSLRGNAVLRWEYRPGSALFLVWQQQRYGEAVLGDFNLDRDADALFRAPAENVFLLKATYWIGR